ncbi:gastrula zinc finger protein XlCGF8.2DB-like [Falco rusticolus]|uniref:gastrula zinc finger protein XlCGF8.2DB-like n=1 Tax=Falco rusticolus TaxID=120794 RepID=UPI0018865111|nr:gastrula zinc finger protein XlCGF8.2DB-like [Falco rusticolus]
MGILAKPLPPCRPLAPKNPAAAWRGKSLGKSRDLWKNQQMHMAAWPFPCLQCGCCFWLRQVLASHQKVHGGEKPFGCADCSKHFAQKHHLLSHWCIHTGEKRFACSHCGHHFSHEHNLVSHLRIRSREYPFACTHCPKAFRDKKTLTLYQHIHTGEKRRVRQDLQPEAAPEEPPAGARGLAGHAGRWLVGWGGGVRPRQGVGGGQSLPARQPQEAVSRRADHAGPPVHPWHPQPVAAPAAHCPLKLLLKGPWGGPLPSQEQ